MTSAASPRWKRIVFKPSGEALAGDSGQGLDAATLDSTAREIIAVREMDVDVCVVVGGGNFWRGRTGAMSGMDATQSDHIGMLGTVMNALALQDALERAGQDTRVQSAIEMPRLCEPYIRRKAMRHLEQGRVVIFAAGTGNPFFTTDTAAALRAAEIDADALLKGTHSGVDGVYSADPRTVSSATKYDEITYIEVMTKDLKVMDATAIAFCRDNAIPIVVFDMSSPARLRAILRGERVGTIIQG
jgi:uridylate kinase